MKLAILGAGPAGLGAAWRVAREKKADVVVLERRDAVGGNAGSFDFDGVRVDYGSHRLHPACPPEILGDLRNLLGDDLLTRPRHGRIRLRGRWLHFPLRPLDAATHLPPPFALGLARDIAVRFFRRSEPATGESTFASQLLAQLGPTICRDFYFPYARKIWGLAPEELSATQARKRVSADSFVKLARRVLSADGPSGRRSFYYPRHGYGQISAALADAARREGAQIRLGERVESIHLGPPHRLTLAGERGQERLDCDAVWSTIPLPALVQLMDPPPPEAILRQSTQIRYRAMILVYLMMATDRFTEFDAHYFPEPDLMLTRLSEPKNYRHEIEPRGKTVLCAEIPCAVEDETWHAGDEELAGRVREALVRCSLPTFPLLGVTTRRLPQAYPIYGRGFEAPLAAADAWVARCEQLLTFGRQGLFAHDNTHHTLAMAYAAASCLGRDGHFDAERWQRHRRAFEEHVVED